MKEKAEINGIINHSYEGMKSNDKAAFEKWREINMKAK